MFTKNSWFGPACTDIESLLNWTYDSRLAWTAPPWLTTGDVLLFYHSLRGKNNIARLSRMKEAQNRRVLRKSLERCRYLADRYAGTVFGYAIVDAPTTYQDNVADLAHFRGRLFASLGKVGIFQRPLPLKALSQHVKLSTGGTITPLSGLAFNKILAELATDNRLPAALRNVRGADLGFRTVRQSNWLKVIPRTTARFIHEIQVRSYFADYVLAILRDPRTPVLEECRCFCGGQMTGVADYFICIGATWIPVETKLSLEAQRDLLAQIGRYRRATSFTPTKGRSRGNAIGISRPPFALVIDHQGLYVHHGRSLTPLLSRSRLTRRGISQARSRLRALAGSCSALGEGQRRHSTRAKA